MNLTKLFETQNILDDRIKKEKGLEGKDLLDEKIRALLTELGELSNEERSFKFWSEDREPNVSGYVVCDLCVDSPGIYEFYYNDELVSVDCPKCEGHQEVYVGNRLLEEYVDCLHFFISIAIELKIKPDKFTVTCDYTQPTVTSTFNRVFSTVSSLEVLLEPCVPASITQKDLQETLHEAFSCFVGLAEKHLGFTWQQIEQAYYEKNEINHQRQESGY